MCLVGSQNVSRTNVKEYSCQKLLTKLRRFSKSAEFSCCTKLILYGYHFRLDFKIFRIADQGRDKSCNTTRALDAEYWELDSLSRRSKANSSTVLFEIHFLPLSRITSKSPVSSDFWIIFSKACLGIGPFYKQFKRRYSSNGVDKLPPFS